MKLIYFITTLLFINTTCVLGQAKYYSTNFGWASIHNGRKVLQKHNGQYILACEVKNNSTNKWNSYITVLDSLSNIVSNFDDTNEDYQSGIFDMTEQNDDFVAVGVLVPANNTVARSYVLRLKSNNELEKYNLGDTTKHTIARTCATTMDNGLLLAGNIDQIGSTPQKLYLIGLDSNYSTIWDTTYYSFVENNTYEDIIALPDGTFYGLATIKDDYWQQANIALLHLSATGIPITIQEYNLGGRDLARCLIPTNDGGILFSASSYPTNNELDGTNYLYKLNSTGDTQWINDTDFQATVVHSMVQLADSTYVVAGNFYATEDYYDAFVAKLDTNGSVLWRRTYGGNQTEYLYDLIINNHNSTGKDGYVMCGRTESTDLGVPLGNANVYFLKTNCMGLLTEPQAQYSYTNPEGNTIAFQNLSQFVYPDSLDGGHYLWDFGDGFNSNEQNPTHTYAQAGVYLAKLTAVVCQDTSLMYQSICIGTSAHPAPSFTHSLQNDTLVSFTNTSSNAQNAVFIWDFGDGTPPTQTITQQPQQHSYSQAGEHQVTLSVIMCQDTTIYTQVVNTYAVGINQVLPLEGGVRGGLWAVLPNPANEQISISPPSGGWGVQTHTFVLYDVLGKEVARQALSVNNTQINVANLPSGIYLYQIINPQNQTLQHGKVSILH